MTESVIRTADNRALSHFSTDPVLSVYSVPQRQQDSDYKSCFEKPKGLWISVDGENDWAEWCENNFDLAPLRHRVYLAEPSKVLWIETCGALIDFRCEYGRDCGRGWNDTYIDWPKVAEKYSGIIIAPYQWSCRMDENWYYGWDCASGCLWDASAVAGIELLRQAA